MSDTPAPQAADSGASADADAVDAVHVLAEGPVWRLVIDNPSQRNALRPSMSRRLATALRDAGHDPHCRVVVLHGAGDTFCSGGDIQAIAEHQQLPPSRQAGRLEAINDLVRAVRRCPRPVLAAVEGHAAGAGASLALACDLIVAARDARFAVAHVRLGISPDGGATLALPRAVPLQLACEWLMQGEPIGAERLHAAGIVNRLVSAGQAVAQALDWAHALSQGAPAAIASIKELVNEAFCPDLDRQLESERREFVRNMFTEDARSRVGRFTRRD